MALFSLSLNKKGRRMKDEDDPASAVPFAPTSDGGAIFDDEEAGVAGHEAAPPIATENGAVAESLFREDEVDQAMQVDASIELDEEGGQLEEGREGDDDDDDISVPPPPPPMPPPTMQAGGAGIDHGLKKKKTRNMALLATVGILVCAGIGLGLGFGLTSEGSSRNANYSNQVDNTIGSSGSTSGNESESVTSTSATYSSTDATSWSTIDATTMTDTDGDESKTTPATATATTTTTSTTGEIQTVSVSTIKQCAVRLPFLY